MRGDADEPDPAEERRTARQEQWDRAAAAYAARSAFDPSQEPGAPSGCAEHPGRTLAYCEARSHRSWP